MFAKVVEEYLKEKKIYILLDNGYYYTKRIQCFEDETEAITAWEKVAKTSFANYQEYIKSADDSREGHWCYSLKTITLWDLFQKELSEQKEQAIREEAEQIRTLGNNKIQTAARKEVEKEFARALDGAIYYLTQIVDYSPAMWGEERKKAFEEGLKKI